MARCRAYTKNGTRCRAQAVDGSDFCRIHQNYDGPLAPMEEEEAMVATQRPYKKFRIRFIGRGSYHYRGYSFTKYGEEKEVPREVFEHLIRQEGWFEEA